MIADSGMFHSAVRIDAYLPYLNLSLLHSALCTLCDEKYMDWLHFNPIHSPTKQTFSQQRK